MTKASVAKLPVDNEVDVRAKAALQLKKSIDTQTSWLEEHKVFFREHAKGEGFKHIVEGLGIVSVNKPSAGGTTTSEVCTVDREAFLRLPLEDQAALIKAGVITLKSVTTTTQPGTPNVVIKPNV